MCNVVRSYLQFWGYFVSDVYLPWSFMHFKVACHLHVGRSVVGIGTKLLDHTGPALSNQFTYLEKVCIFEIICRILQQSCGDSDDNRQSQTACLRLWCFVLEQTYIRQLYVQYCIISLYKELVEGKLKVKTQVVWDATLYQVGTRILDKCSAFFFRVEQPRKRIYFITSWKSHLPYICSDGEVCMWREDFLIVSTHYHTHFQ